MKAGDRVFVLVFFDTKNPGTVRIRLEDDSFLILLDGDILPRKFYSDELEPMTKLHKLLAGEEDA